MANLTPSFFKDKANPHGWLAPINECPCTAHVFSTHWLSVFKKCFYAYVQAVRTAMDQVWNHLSQHLAPKKCLRWERLRWQHQFFEINTEKSNKATASSLPVETKERKLPAGGGSSKLRDEQDNWPWTWTTAAMEKCIKNAIVQEGSWKNAIWATYIITIVKAKGKTLKKMM